MTAAESCPEKIEKFQRPVIDLEATGKRIEFLRKSKNLAVKNLQSLFGFETPQAIYTGNPGKTCPQLITFSSCQNFSKLISLKFWLPKIPKNRRCQFHNRKP